MKSLFKKIYDLIPFKGFFFRILRFVWKPNESVYKHLHFKGVIKVKVGESSHFKIHHRGHHIENELFWSGLEYGFEKLSVTLWMKLSKKADIIFDIGAYSGLYSLTSATLNPEAKIYAFEPMKHNFNLLNKNIQLNNFPNVSTIQKACSNFSGEAIVYTEKNTTLTTSVTVNKSLYEEDIELDTIPIETIRIDNYVATKKIEGLDLIKIDVETHEHEVLLGMGDLIKKHKPTFLIEVLNDEVGKNIQSLVEGLDYLYFDIDEIDSITQVNSIKQSSYYNYLICQENVAKELNLI
ncbi:MAG: FkbM family methyltransferase [Vicingaceae bacterium]|nr:FkbM family methyltransferase [Vicingaceae bacterium]